LLILDANCTREAKSSPMTPELVDEDEVQILATIARSDAD
jgi:hypothetical protein